MWWTIALMTALGTALFGPTTGAIVAIGLGLLWESYKPKP